MEKGLGEGTSATVSRGAFKVPAAIKRFKEPMGKKDRQDFVREGEILRALSHPNIARLLGVTAEVGCFCLLMEEAKGVQLSLHLHGEGPLGPSAFDSPNIAQRHALP